MTQPDVRRQDAAGRDDVTLRLVWPQWQGGPRTTSRSSPRGASGRSARTISARRPDRSWTRSQLADARFPRQVMHLRQILDGFPLISGTAATR
jgi:hypothetical protein